MDGRRSCALAGERERLFERIPVTQTFRSALLAELRDRGATANSYTL